MLVGEDHRGGIQLQHTLHDDTRIDRSRIDRAPEQRLVGQHLVHAVQEHSGEYLIGLSDQFQTQVVPYSGRLAEARSSFEDPSLQQHDGLLDDPVLVLGSDGGKRLQAGVIDGERHGEPPDGEIGGHSPWEGKPSWGTNKVHPSPRQR
jgi:hypothetical protein